MKTNFEHIREDAFRLIELKDCPEMAKDILVKMVADEESLVMFIKTLTVMCAASDRFAQLVLTGMTSLAIGVIIIEDKDE